MRIAIPVALAVAAIAVHPARGNSAPAHAATPQTARHSVVKVEGVTECQTVIEGSGFVYAPKHVMTNGHVVAGMREPQIITQDNRTLRGRVVLYDPRRDVAVIYVPGLRGLPPLEFDDSAHARGRATIAGFPEDGPFDARDARIRSKNVRRESDLYETTTVTLETYAIHGRVRHGNSGGPLLSPDGRVYGVVYAMATAHKDVGFALTADEVSPDAKAGEAAESEVSTHSCATVD
jgi:S1-C subfamily serine protease